MKQPTPIDWLALDEQEAIDLVSDYHEAASVELPSPVLHATLHTIVENQIALGEQVVIDTIARLGAEGLDRHESIHAIGTVLIENIQAALSGKLDQSNIESDYQAKLASLSAAKWREYI